MLFNVTTVEKLFHYGSSHSFHICVNLLFLITQSSNRGFVTTFLTFDYTL